MKISDVLTLKASSKVAEYLKSAPTDEIFSATELSNILDIPESTIKSSKDLKPHSFSYCGRTYYARHEVRHKFFETVDQDEHRES